MRVILNSLIRLRITTFVLEKHPPWRLNRMVHSIAVYASQYKMRHMDDIPLLLLALADRGVVLSLEHTLLDMLAQEGIHIDHPNISDGGDTPHGEIAISLGGDGTLLRAVHKLRDLETPIWAINCGHLGFMTELEPREAMDYLSDLVDRRYSVETRSLIDVSVDGEHIGTALNDVAVQKRETGSMIQIETMLDGTLLAKYAADGLVLSTPSGSTAYSLSLGGPIVMPHCRTMSLTPIAPHSLNMAPLIFPDSSVLSMRVSSLHPTFSISIDGNMRVYQCGVEISAHRSDRQARLVRLLDKPYAEVIREKLHWGRDLR